MKTNSGKISITKKDVAWGYIGQLFSLFSGLITLAIILKMLSPEEVGMNYIMLTISTLVSLLDFGFAAQFGLNFTLIHSGSQRLLKEGVEHNENGQINYHLLAVLLETAKKVYRRLSLFCIFLMLTFGTLYIYNVTNKFDSVHNSLYIWILYSISTYFNIYYIYYVSLLRGAGYISEINKAEIISKLTYIALCVSLLYCGMGLMSVVIANFIAPFVQRWYCRRVYFTEELVKKIDIRIKKNEIKETFITIWHNTKKRGINLIGSYMVNKSSMFIIGFFLPLSSIGSYGLLLQLTNFVMVIAQSMFNSFYPIFSKLRVENKKEELIKSTALSIVINLLMMIVGCAIIVFIVPELLVIFNSQTKLPTIEVCVVYCIAQILENNHSVFSTLITSNNEVPFVKSSLLSGAAIIILTILSLTYTNCDLLGVVFAPLIVQAMYNNWRWPKWVLDEFHISFINYLRVGCVELKQSIRKLILSLFS